jgi:hypothetical protein
MVAAVVELPNLCCAPAADLAGQVHADLTAEHRWLRIAGDSSRAKAGGNDGVYCRQGYPPFPEFEARLVANIYSLQ